MASTRLARRLQAVAVTVLLLSLLVLTSLYFARADRIDRIGRDAELMAAATDVNVTAVKLQTDLSTYLLSADAVEQGLEVGADLGELAARVDETLGLLVVRIDALNAVEDQTDLEPELLVEATNRVLDTPVAIAATTARNEFLPAVRTTLEISSTVRDAAASRIAAERAWAGTVSQAASWAVALVIPLSVVLLYRAISRRDLESTRLEAKLRREQAVVAAKDQLITNLSHELRTPLTSILGFTMTMDNSYTDPETVDLATAKEVNELVMGEAANLSRMVEDLLVIEVPDESLVTHPASMPASWLIGSAVDLFNRTEVEKIVVEGDMHPVMVDSDRVIHILRNLISNAIKHGARPIRVVGRPDGDRFLIEVRDAGPGLAAERLPSLFTRFVHDDEATTEGSVGLGTAVAKKLALASGGDLEYLRDGDETVFRLALPRYDAGEIDAA